MPTLTRIYVPADSAALALGADDVATAIAAEAKRLGAAVEIVRNGSRGMHWLEPLVEVRTASGRIGYGPVTAADVPGLIKAGLLEGGAHPLCLGDPAQHPFLARQTRWTFVRCGIIDPVSWGRLHRPWRWPGPRPCPRAGCPGDAHGDHGFRAAGPRRCGLPRGHQVAHRPRRARRHQVRRLQRR